MTRQPALFEEGGCLAAPLSALLDRVPADWRPVVDRWRDSEAGRSLACYLDERVAAGATVYPAAVFRALELTPLADVKAVIVGQDPYHGPGQAHGLAFSVPTGQKTPPSLRNMLLELKRDLGVERSGNDLSGWARQGVLLLNTSLTVEDGQPASHARRGWESLTEALLQAVARRPEPCAYLLWGAHAQRFEPLIRSAVPAVAPAPLVLMSNHPSPLSARRPPVPFLGNGHFGEALRYLAAHGRPIDWSA
ncbi:MAG: uracil-DNA glycosylase [Rhizobacter sp.]